MYTEDHEEVARHARKLLDSRFLKQAESAAGQAKVEHDLDAKIEKLSGRSELMGRLRELAGQAASLWRQRKGLERKQVVYLAAGLLYFISPIDAVTDLIPLLGYVDDVMVLGWVLSQLTPAARAVKGHVAKVRDDTIAQATDTLVDKGRVAMNELIDDRTEELLERVDQAAEDTVQKYVTGVVIGLWGTTTAAGVSLALTTLAGGYSQAWLTWVLMTSTLVVIWNAAVAISFLRAYRNIEGRWRERLPRLIGAKVMRWRHLLAVSLPLLAFVGLAVAHAMVLG